MPPTNGAMSAGLLGFVGPENSWRPLNHFLHENMVVLHLRHHGGLEQLPFSWLLERQHSSPLTHACIPCYSWLRSYVGARKVFGSCGIIRRSSVCVVLHNDLGSLLLCQQGGRCFPSIS